jgi:hypothetical protein
VPQLVLNNHEKKVWQKARSDRNAFMMDVGFGQFKDLYTNPNTNGMRVFFERTKHKIERLQSFFGKSYFQTALFGLSLVSLLIISRGHWSFYLFIFSAFFIAWWIFMPCAMWYRYFFISEFIAILGIAAFLPFLIANKNRCVFVLLLIVLVGFSLPRFSFHSIKQSLSGEGKENLMLMMERIEKIDEKNIFTFGWLQCPQLMFLTNKRFQDFFNKEKLEEAKKDGAYFLTTYDNILIQDEMDTITKGFDLIASYGYNKLYRIK